VETVVGLDDQGALDQERLLGVPALANQAKGASTSLESSASARSRDCSAGLLIGSLLLVPTTLFIW
jgi:hypothetical protein